MMISVMHDCVCVYIGVCGGGGDEGAVVRGDEREEGHGGKSTETVSGTAQTATGHLNLIKNYLMHNAFSKMISCMHVIRCTV